MLGDGEIEDYLPPGFRDVAGIVRLIEDSHWINSLEGAALRKELGTIACKVLSLDDHTSHTILNEIERGTVKFERLNATTIAT